jgi:hypothetical protein
MSQSINHETHESHERKEKAESGKADADLIGGGEAEDVADFGANLAAAFQADAAAMIF